MSTISYPYLPAGPPRAGRGRQMLSQADIACNYPDDRIGVLVQFISY